MKFDFEKYKDTDKKKYGMLCTTREQAEDFCSVMHEAGRRWISGESYLERSNFDCYKHETVYDFNKGLYDDLYSSLKNGYTVLMWGDFMNKEFTKKDLKNGDVVVRRDGSVGIVCTEVGVVIGQNEHSEMRLLTDDLRDYRINYDIMDIYRPKRPWQCQFHKEAYLKGEHVYHRDESPVEITIEEIARLKGVSATRIRIKGYEKKRQEHDYIF